MITLDLSILNQKGTPMFYSDTLALRPAFGIVGRIFIATDSPYGIFRDTGSAWDQIAGSGGGGITGSGTLNTIAMFTPSGTEIGNSLITQSGINILVARNLIVTNGSFTLSHIHPSLNGTVNPLGQQIGVTNTFQAGITWTALLACFNSSSLQTNLFNGSVTFGNGSYTTNNLNLSNITFNAAGSTITSTQASGGIRAYANQILQLRIDGTNNGTYTHYANSAIYGDFASSTARFTITNRYGYLVNNLDEYSAGHTYTNRWAFYNAGINDNNFFAGKVGIGSGYVPSTLQLDVIGQARINAATSGTNYSFTIADTNSTIGTSLFFNFSTANLLLQVTGNGTRMSGTNGKIFQSFRYSTGAVIIGSDELSVAPDRLNINVNSATTDNQGISILDASGSANVGSAISWLGNAGSTTMARIKNIIQSGYNNSVLSFSVSNNTGVITEIYRITETQNLLVGSTTNIPSAILAAASTTKGFLPPKMTTTQKNNIVTPVSGLLVFDTTLVKLCVYNGATWETVTSI